MNKYIFLDFDGVLNHELWYRRRAEIKTKEEAEDFDFGQIDPNSVELLNYLIEKTGAKVIISSSWRSGNSIEYLQNLLENKGFKGEIIDKTGHLTFQGIEGYTYSVPRGCEIKAWLEMNKDIHGDKMSKVRYVILDDDSDMLYWQRNNFFQVDRFCGLTPELISRAIQFLNN